MRLTVLATRTCNTKHSSGAISFLCGSGLRLLPLDTPSNSEVKELCPVDMRRVPSMLFLKSMDVNLEPPQLQTCFKFFQCSCHRLQHFLGYYGLVMIVSNIFTLCGRQDICHREDCIAESLSNRGNFMAILELAAKSDDVLRSHLETGHRNQRYTSKTIQNDVIITIGDVVREKCREGKMSLAKAEVKEIFV